ncbi:MAG: tetratricopeptide repeat protein, partial [Bacteroidales bacterium]|nr:tetratricopeptide repeat protein [Bacteroidales bacterium]
MRFSSHDKVAEKSRKLLEKCNKIHYQKGAAYARLNIASAGFYSSRNDIALKHLAEAMKWFEQNRHEPGYAMALLLKGNIYESLGDFEKTLDLWLKAWKQSIESGDRESEGEACSQLGLIYSRLCNFTKALEFSEEGLKIRDELGDENAVASSLNRIGMLLRQTKKFSESLGFYFRSLDIRRKNNQTSAIPWTLLGIAATYEEMKDFEKSLCYYSEGQRNADKRCALQCMMGEGRVLSHLGDFKMAESKLSESLRMARELKSQALVAEALHALANHYEYSGQPGKALKHFKLYLKARESFQSSEAQSRLNNVEVAHAIERSEQEKEIYRLKHVELKQAYDIIEEKNKDITASISYASRIQNAMLPDPEEITELRKNMFILYLPRDIVSGDFYWFAKVDGKYVIAAGD